MQTMALPPVAEVVFVEKANVEDIAQVPRSFVKAHAEGLPFAGVAVRSGHHCTQPLHAYLGINASARASPYIYNTEEEIDIFIRELEESISFFREVA